MRKTEIEKTLEELGFRVRDEENNFRDREELATEIINKWDTFSEYHKVLFLLILEVAARIDEKEGSK